MPRTLFVGKRMLIGMYCSLAVVVGDPAYGRFQPAPGANPAHVAHDVAPVVRFADAWDYQESRQPPSRTCRPCVVTLAETAAREALRIPVSAWAVMAVVFILAGINFPSLWFLGVAGFLVWGTSQFFNLTWQLQLVVFGLSGVCLVLTWSRLDQPAGRRASDEIPNCWHPATMLGRVLQLQKPIVNGTGMLTIGGTMWRVAGPDCAAGDQVLVVHVEGTLLVVNAIAR